MKQKLLAVLTALALSLGLVGCNVTTPATVGTIGEVEITAGIYLISQFQAYQTVSGYANTEQSSMSVSAFLKETVYVAEDGTMAPEPAEGEEQTGEAVLVSTFIESETLVNLQYYAAVETLFAELGGVLSEADVATADSYADQLWEYYSDIYEANGIGLSSLKTYQYTSLKNSALLDLMYGTEGVDAVSDDALMTYLNDEMIYAQYVSVPLYNTSDYTFADSDQQDTIVAALSLAVDEYETAMLDVEDGVGTAYFLAALENNISAAYEVMGSTYEASDVSAELTEDLFSYTELADYFDEDTLATISALGFNEAAAFKADYTSAMVMLRIDPIEYGYTLDDLRDTLLTELKSDELVAYVEDLGAGYTNGLDTSAMAEYPASKVVTG